MGGGFGLPLFHTGRKTMKKGKGKGKGKGGKGC